jgi:cytochrome c oxidase assembly protein subunit 15
LGSGVAAPYGDLVRLPRLSPTAYRRITLAALLALCGIVVTGAAVRLTGSGLGCSDWPTCEDDRLVAPLEYHAIVEFVNRTITGLVSVAVILAVLGSLVREPKRRDLTWWSLGLVAGVLGQIVLGGITVLFHLNPLLVQSHFLLSMVLVWDAVVLHHRAALPEGGDGRGLTGPRPPELVVRLATLVPVLAVGLLAAGTVVTGTGPHGGDEEVKRLPLEIEAVARTHGIVAVLFLLCTLGLVLVARRTPGLTTLVRWSTALLWTAAAQAALGYWQYFNGVPPFAVGVHVALATIVWVLAVQVALTARSPLPHPSAGAAARPDEDLVGAHPPR